MSAANTPSVSVAALMDALPGATMLLADDARLRYANAPAVALLAAYPGFKQGNGRLAMRRRADQAALESAMAQVAARPGEVHAVCLPSRLGEPVLVLQLAQLAGSDLVLASFNKLAGRVVPPESLMRHLLLTPAQARAAALLAAGLSVPEIAARLCLGSATVQTQLRQCMVRLGQRSQLQLAIVVATFANALGTPPGRP